MAPLMTPAADLAPTPEQAAIIDAFTTGESVRVAAGAGTGKTTVLRMAAETAPTRRGLYVAFNKAIATDAEQAFGRNVKVSTTHSLAYQAVGHQYRHRLNGPRVPAQKVAQFLGIRGAIPLAGRPPMQPSQQARYAQDMVRQFTSSADETITAGHLPTIMGISDAEHAGIGATLLPFAQRLWADKVSLSGQMRYEHDDYLKQYALTHPAWGAHFILFDECQDTTPVVLGMVKDQQAAGAQIIVVGDSSQAIYGWRGAISAMDLFDTPHRRSLTQSWRFGQAVADEANKWLSILDAELRLTGNPTSPSRVVDGPSRDVDAVLCRTNATAVTEIVHAQQSGRRAAVVGGGGDARRLAEAAQMLQQGRGTWHPELALFPTWGAVQDFADEPGGSDLRPFVRLIDSLGADTVMAAIDGCVPEQGADLVVSTAHKAKGREWDRVLIADDFTEPDTDAGESIEAQEAMLAYVSVTRAKKVLHRDGLAWVDQWDSTGPASRPAPAPATPTVEQTTVTAPEQPVVDPLTLTLTPAMSQALRDLAAADGSTPDDVVDDLIRRAHTGRGLRRVAS